MLLDCQELGGDSPEFVLNRLRMHKWYMETVWAKFDGSVHAMVPLFDQEVRGVVMLRKAVKVLFGQAEK